MNRPSSLLEGIQVKVVKGGSLVLDIPSLQIKAGEILALLGPNGAGKTTLMQTLSFLVKPFTGEILFKGEKICSRQSIFKYRRKLAMVFQEPLLFNTTVFLNVASGLKIRGMSKSEIRRVVVQEAERFGIAHLIDRSARTLSGGEAQRTSLARAFAICPEILFLDEPFASLDPPTRESLLEDLERILRQTRTTTIFATHDLMEAVRLSDRMAVMNGGKILQIDSPSNVMNRPVNEFIASFVGVETILVGRVITNNRGTFLSSIEGRTIEAVGDAHPGETVVLCVRPENVTLSPSGPHGITSARNVFSGRITKIAPLGFYQKVYLDCGFPLVAYVTNHSREALSLEEGKEVTASFKATAIHVVRRGKKEG
jgi:tungstate transport system ATP-binding protein